MVKLFGGVFKGKRVLVTGHTGFKGSWLSTWLLELGAEVTGFSCGIPTTPSNFAASLLKKRLRHIEADIRDIAKLKQAFKRSAPQVVFHLAAQPITRFSYQIPQETFFTNVGGTVNVLDCLRQSNSARAAVIVTSDKCYKNREWQWGYRENDALGGDDPYSASKACSELVFHSYSKSFFGPGKNPCRLASARAGNVIGGGDWAKFRIVPDCVRAFSRGQTASIRNPLATRPWQHVLEPLSGYLWLAAQLLDKKIAVGESFNFGPDQKVNESVADLIKIFVKYFGSGDWKYQKEARAVKESLLLKLSCDKALKILGWHPALSFEETVEMTADWYRRFYESRPDMFEFSLKQIGQYVSRAKKEGLQWARSD